MVVTSHTLVSGVVHTVSVFASGGERFAAKLVIALPAEALSVMLPIDVGALRDLFDRLTFYFDLLL